MAGAPMKVGVNSQWFPLAFWGVDGKNGYLIYGN
jgi:hypothetical protein